MGVLWGGKRIPPNCEDSLSKQCCWLKINIKKICFAYFVMFQLCTSSQFLIADGTSNKRTEGRTEAQFFTNVIILTRKSNPYSITKLNSSVYTCIDLWVTLLRSAAFKCVEMTVMNVAHIQMIQKAYRES